MILRASENSNLPIGSLSSWLFTAGVLGVIGAIKFSFIAESMRTPVFWIAILLILVSVLLRVKLIMANLKSRRAVELELSRTRPARRKKAAVKKNFPTALYLVSLVVLALGLALIFLTPQGYQSYLMQSSVSSWPETTGEVISAEVIVDERGFSSEDDMYQPRVITQYKIGDRVYTTREIHFNQSSSWRSNRVYADAMIDKYAPGTQVSVFYNPEESSVAVLNTQTDWVTYFIMAFGAILLLIGMYWFWLSIRDTYLFFTDLEGSKNYE
jgi:hypothetical protein